MKPRTRVLATVALVIASTSAPVAAEEVEVYARVIVDATPLRSGPGPGFRRTGIATRGDTFRVRRRGTRGYWFQIERRDGTLAWILGDAVYNHELGEEDAPGNRIFAPPPLAHARMEIAAVFGVLGTSGGMMAVRPSLLLAPTFGIELTGAVSVSRAGRILIAAAGGIVNVFPQWPVVPYLVVGGGVAVSDPSADTFLLEEGRSATLYGGGGLRFGFRQRITLRIEARAYAFFEPDRQVSQEEYSGGLSVFF